VEAVAGVGERGEGLHDQRPPTAGGIGSLESLVGQAVEGGISGLARSLLEQEPLG
jgi:hypothetical protein